MLSIEMLCEIFITLPRYLVKYHNGDTVKRLLIRTSHLNGNKSALNVTRNAASKTYFENGNRFDFNL